MRIRTHAAIALRRQLRKLGFQAASLVEQFVRPITLHPFLEDLDVCRFFVHLTHRHLMAPPVVFGPFAIDLLRAGPSFWRTKNNHGPQWSLLGSSPLGLRLDAVDFFD